MKSKYDEDVFALVKVNDMSDNNIKQQQRIQSKIQARKQNHQLLVQRVDKLLTIMNMLQTRLSKAEVDYYKEQKELELELHTYQKKVDHLKDMAEKVRDPPTQIDFQMTPDRINKVTSILADQGEAIQTTVNSIKTLQSEINSLTKIS